MRLAVLLVVTAASVAGAAIQKDFSILLTPCYVALFLWIIPFEGRRKRPARPRRSSTGAAAAGTAVGADGTVTAVSWWADGTHAHGGDKADAGGDGGGHSGGDGGGCGGGCGGCGCGG